ncbi:hypothetical protein NLU13_4027 [Sarocladium strictum]|uniref:BZIP domain-containing protein n=1 Tax=Sarocladium strictum TaxID=5046 RepID=A0AA39L892_SARSR|nr:hypothetical protein NLU13_4027 [Sarocladium strictum]
MSHAPARVGKSGPSSQKQTGFVTKWALDDAAPSEDAIRVRNNQRRHRERVKTYIADLEAKVAALEAGLSAANDHIGVLTRENERLRMASTRAEPPPLAAGPHAVQQETVSLSALRPIPPTAEAFAVPETRGAERFCCRPRRRGDKTDDDGMSDKEDLPAARDGESTTECETAYRMLEQQSAGRLDKEAAEQFLRPGFRRASRPGDGCRVQTHLVYGLLDHLTS